MHTLVTLGAPRVHINFAIFLFEDRPGIVQNALLAVCTRRSGALLALESVALVTVRVALTLLQLIVRSCPRTDTHAERERESRRVMYDLRNCRLNATWEMLLR